MSQTVPTTPSARHDLRSVDALADELRNVFPAGIRLSVLLRRIARDAPHDARVFVVDSVAFAAPLSKYDLCPEVVGWWHTAGRDVAPTTPPACSTVQQPIEKPSKKIKRRTNTHLPQSSSL